MSSQGAKACYGGIVVCTAPRPVMAGIMFGRCDVVNSLHESAPRAWQEMYKPVVEYDGVGVHE